MGGTPQCSVSPCHLRRQTILKKIFPPFSFLISCDAFQPTTRAPLRSLIKFTYLPPLCWDASFMKSFASTCRCFWCLEHLKWGNDEFKSLCKDRFLGIHLTGFKKDDWDQVFSMWQAGQYRAPVIKPLPVKHPAIIDEFPLGRAELSLGLEGQERGILNMEPVLVCSSQSVRGKQSGDFWLKNKDQETRSLLALTG